MTFAFCVRTPEHAYLMPKLFFPQVWYSSDATPALSFFPTTLQIQKLNYMEQEEQRATPVTSQCYKRLPRNKEQMAISLE